MNPTKTLTSILTLLVFFGILAMVLKNPTGSVAILGAGASTIAGVTQAVEGKKATG
jgi:hypothetical protein